MRRWPLVLLAAALLATPAAAQPWGVWLPGPGASGDWHWMPPVAVVGDLPADPDGSVRLVIADAALHCRTAGAWSACSGGGTDDQTAAEVPIADAGGLYTATDVEGALQETPPGARTPTAHASTHGAAASDPVTLTEAQISDLSHTTDTDDQTAAEVPYTPSTPADWTDPDPTEVGGAIDRLVGGEVAASFDTLTGGTSTGETFIVGTGSSLRISGSGVIGASEIDGDGDGTADLAVDVGVNANVNQKMTVIFTNGVNSELNSYSPVGHRFKLVTNNTSDAIWLRPNNNQAAFQCGEPNGFCESMYDFRFGATAVFDPSTATCPDSGDANPGSVVITPSTSRGQLDSNDSDGCAVTFTEPSAGTQLYALTVSSTAGGPITLTDSPGALELPGGTTITLTNPGDYVALEWKDLSGTTADAWYVTNSQTY